MPAYPGNKLLFHAIQHINIPDTIKLLEEKEADVNAENVNNSTPLHFAVMTHNQALVEILLKYGANPNHRDNIDVGYCSALHRAVEQDDLKICQLLLENGADSSLKQKNGQTPLHLACRFGFKDIVNLLLSKGSDINARDNQGNTPSYWAKAYQHFDLLEFLPPPLTIQIDDLYEFKKQFRTFHQVVVKIKGKKKKKKKK